MKTSAAMTNVKSTAISAVTCPLRLRIMSDHPSRFDRLHTNPEPPVRHSGLVIVDVPVEPAVIVPAPALVMAIPDVEVLAEVCVIVVHETQLSASCWMRLAMRLRT